MGVFGALSEDTGYSPCSQLAPGCAEPGGDAEAAGINWFCRAGAAGPAAAAGSSEFWFGIGGVRLATGGAFATGAAAAGTLDGAAEGPPAIGAAGPPMAGGGAADAKSEFWFGIGGGGCEAPGRTGAPAAEGSTGDGGIKGLGLVRG